MDNDETPWWVGLAHGGDCAGIGVFGKWAWRSRRRAGTDVGDAELPEQSQRRHASDNDAVPGRDPRQLSQASTRSRNRLRQRSWEAGFMRAHARSTADGSGLGEPRWLLLSTPGSAPGPGQLEFVRPAAMLGLMGNRITSMLLVCVAAVQMLGVSMHAGQRAELACADDRDTPSTCTCHQQAGHNCPVGCECGDHSHDDATCALCRASTWVVIRQPSSHGFHRALATTGLEAESAAAASAPLHIPHVERICEPPGLATIVLPLLN